MKVTLPVTPGGGVKSKVPAAASVTVTVPPAGLVTLVELTAKGRDLRQEMFNLRLQQASAQLEKPARLRLLRRDIARIETRISQLRRKAA